MSNADIHVGVLDIQGSVEEHRAVLARIAREGAPASATLVKTAADLEEVDGLIIPGGESTVIGKLMKEYGLDEAIRKRGSSLVLWGTCAGAILLAKKVTNRDEGGKSNPPESLNLMDIEIERNAYGRQLDSFETEISAPELGSKKIPAVFIRAPRVKKASPKVKILAEYGGAPVMLQQGNILATMFHPELTDDMRTHKYFVSLVKNYAKERTTTGKSRP